MLVSRFPTGLMAGERPARRLDWHSLLARFADCLQTQSCTRAISSTRRRTFTAAPPSRTS